MIPIDKVLMYNAISTIDKDEKESIVECIIREVGLYSIKEEDGKKIPDKLIRVERSLLLIPINKTGIVINLTFIVDYNTLISVIKETLSHIVNESEDKVLEVFFYNNKKAVEMFENNFLRKYIDEFINKKEGVSNETN